MWLIIYLSIFVLFNIVQSEYYDIRTTAIKLKSISPSIHPSTHSGSYPLIYDVRK